MPVEILKASVGDYSVNTSKRGVTVNQQYLGDRDYNWGPAEPVHKWYLGNPKATVAQVAEQLDKLPKEVMVQGYKVYVNRDTLIVRMPEHVKGGNYVSLSPFGSGDEVTQYLRKHYNGNKSTDVAECARLIEEYFNPSSIEVLGYKVAKATDGTVIVYQPGERQSYWSPATMKWADYGPEAIKHLRKHTNRETTVRETAKLIEEFLAKQEITVRGVQVYRIAGSNVTGTAGAHSIPGLFEYLESKGTTRLSVAEVAKLIEEYEEPRVVKGHRVFQSARGTEVDTGDKGLERYLYSKGSEKLSVSQVAKLIEDYKFTKVTVETEAGKKEFGSVNDAVEFTEGTEVTCRFRTECLGNRWYLTRFSDFGVLFNTGSRVTKKVKDHNEAKQYIQDKEIPF